MQRHDRCADGTALSPIPDDPQESLPAARQPVGIEPGDRGPDDESVVLGIPQLFDLVVLGPNGAGKTTAVRILTTLSRPDSGWARVAGHDVVREAAAVQRNIGVTAQDATVDEVLTGRQNLVMIGRLSGLRRREARDRDEPGLEVARS